MLQAWMPSMRLGVLLTLEAKWFFGNFAGVKAQQTWTMEVIDNDFTTHLIA